MKPIIFTEIQRLEILDCLPPTENREAYLYDLEYHAQISPVFGKMRVGKKKPFAMAVVGALDKMENCIDSVETSFSALAQAHQEEGYAPIPEAQVEEEIEKIREAIGRLLSLHIKNTPYNCPFVDGREKKLEKHLINVTLALWCRHFPENPLPKDPRQGRLRGGHDESPALRLCGIVIEVLTGEKRKDLRKLYQAGLKEWEASGVPLFHPRRWEEEMNERVRKFIQENPGLFRPHPPHIQKNNS